MFGILSSLTKATVGVVVDTPVSIVRDVVEKGIMLDDKDDLYTERALLRILKNLENATDPD
jgi:hypothetical protein